MAIQEIQKLALAILALGIIIGVGIVILTNFGDMYAGCTSGITSETQVNETGWLNDTGYTLLQSYRNEFTSPVINVITNNSDGVSFPVNNVTISSGVIKNTTFMSWNTVNITYTYTWNDLHSWNSTTQTCQNLTGGDAESGTGSAYTTTSTVSGYLGTSSGGLATWIPIIIVLIIGMIFLRMFLGRQVY